jgi:dihydropteroate synthase
MAADPTARVAEVRTMANKLLFLTGRLAEPRLQRTVEGLGLPDGSWRIANVGVKVAALMTEAIVRNRLKAPLDADRVIVPGRSRMDLGELKNHYGVPFERGPDEIIDLPQYFGKGAKPADLSRYDLRIFAEIIDAPGLTVDDIVTRAKQYKAEGADVIDIGCQPDVPFPQLEDMIAALRKLDFKVSVDSGDVEELHRGAKAGADYVLSLDETSLDAIAGTKTVPILVPKPHGDLSSLIRAVDLCKAKGIPCLADPVLDPIHFGFMTSLERYARLRRERPDVEILMGTGNLTELTDADSQGVTAVLLGICSELQIRNVLVVQVSPHTRRTVLEHDAARRLMYRAREDESLPKGYGGGLLSLHDLRPYPETPEQVAAMAAGVRDQNFRIEVAEDGIHIYNRDGHHVARDPFALFDKLGVEADGAHAFYLGYELAKAEIAAALGKRYTQDGSLDWGVAADRKSEDLTRHAAEGATLKAARKEKADAAYRRNRRDDEEREG